VQIIANGSTAENGKSNGGLINFITKSGTTGSRAQLVQRQARFVNKNDYLRIRQNQPKPLYDVNIGGYTIGGPVIIPKVFDSRTARRKVFFFFSQEYTSEPNRRSRRPRTFLRRWSARATSRRLYCQRHRPADHRPADRASPFKNIIPSNRFNSVGQPS